MAIALSVSAYRDSDVVDEAYHLRNGYIFLKTGVLPVETEHPPLAQVISALPLLPLHLRTHPAGSETRDAAWQSASGFLYDNTSPAETILLAGRSAKILLTLAFGCVLVWWVRRRFGPAAALAALLLFAFDPSVLAHGHLATTDLAAAFGFFAGCIAWDAFLARGDARSAFLCGLVTGAAIAVKFSALLLPALYVAMYFLYGFQQAAALKPPAWRISPGNLCKSLAALAVGIALAIYASYGFETRPLFTGELAATPFSEVLAANHYTHPIVPVLARHPALMRWLNQAAVSRPIPAPSFFRGFLSVSRHNALGHNTYFLQQRSGTGGFWYYFPVLFRVKSPTGLVMLLPLALAAVLLLMFQAGPREAIFKVLRARRGWLVLTVPPLVYFTISTTSRINIGIRHILPVYPFVFVWIAAALFADRRTVLPALLRWSGVACLALVAVESAAAFPRYISFFNWPSGGREQGWKYVVDSNLDWGQDMKRLQAYLLRRNAAGNVCLANFSGAPPEHFGITAHPVPASAKEARAQGCLVIVSLSVLHEWPPEDGSLAWLLHRDPSERVADSFNVYDVGAGSERSSTGK